MSALIASFRHALRGLGFIIRYERNARLHLLIALGVTIAAFSLDLSSLEMVAVAFSIVIVFLSEIFNSAIEELCDLAWPGQHQKIRHVKDITAAGVLVAATSAAVIGAVIFSRHLF